MVYDASLFHLKHTVARILRLKIKICVCSILWFLLRFISLDSRFCYRLWQNLTLNTLLNRVSKLISMRSWKKILWHSRKIRATKTSKWLIAFLILGKEMLRKIKKPWRLQMQTWNYRLQRVNWYNKYYILPLRNVLSLPKMN